MDEELTDSENEEEQQRDSPNQGLDEGTRDQPPDGKSPGTGRGDDSEPCCSSAVVDSISSGNAEPSGAPKVETQISTDDKVLPPHDKDNQSISSEDLEVRRGMDDICLAALMLLSHSTSANRSVTV